MGCPRDDLRQHEDSAIDSCFPKSIAFRNTTAPDPDNATQELAFKLRRYHHGMLGCQFTPWHLLINVARREKVQTPRHCLRFLKTTDDGLSTVGWNIASDRRGTFTRSPHVINQCNGSLRLRSQCVSVILPFLKEEGTSHSDQSRRTVPL